MDKLYKHIDSKVGMNSLAAVEKVTPSIIKETVRKFNSDKTDPVHSLTSDFLKNAPDILFRYLAIIIKSFLVHSHASYVLLLAALVPIVKSKMGEKGSSKNYRSITISSLILKILTGL